MKSSLRLAFPFFLLPLLVVPILAQHVIKTVTVGTAPNGISTNTTTNVVYVSNTGTNTVSVIDGASNTVTATIITGNAPGPIAVYVPANLIFVYNTKDKTMSIIDGYTNTVNKTEAVPFGVTAMTLLGQSKYLYVSDASTELVHVVDVTTLRKIADISVPAPSAIAANAVGKLVYVTSAGAAIIVINTTTNTATGAFFPPANNNFSSISADATDNLLYATICPTTSPTNCSIEGLNATTGVVLGTTPAIGAVNQVFAMPGIKKAVISGGTGKTLNSLTFVSGTAYNVTATVTVGNNPTAIGYYLKTLTVYVTNQASNSVSVVGS